MTKTVLLLLAIFLFAVTTPPLPAAAGAAPDPVLDIAGEKIRTGVDYHILPVIRGRGGGLTLASTRNKSCPLDVVQELHEVSNGLPVTFSPVNLTKVCVQSTVWKLDKFDESRSQWFVTSGGVEGNPGRQTTSNWFKIEKYDSDYKLVFCPTVCNFCKVLCRDVGVYIEEGRRLLALSDVPFIVMFKKA
ncbi:hypothetical protein SLA2020_351920 [Shorea laevis]